MDGWLFLTETRNGPPGLTIDPVAACEVSPGSGFRKLQPRSRTERSRSATSGGLAAAHRPPALQAEAHAAGAGGQRRYSLGSRSEKFWPPARAASAAAQPKKRKAQERVLSFKIIPRRRPTLPRGLPRSTIGAEGLNGRVRNGNGCGPFAKVTGKTSYSFPVDSAGAFSRQQARESL